MTSPSIEFRGQVAALLHSFVSNFDKSMDDLGMEDAEHRAQYMSLAKDVERALAARLESVQVLKAQLASQLDALGSQVKAVSAELVDTSIEDACSLIQQSPSLTLTQKRAQTQALLDKARKLHQDRTFALQTLHAQIKELADALGVSLHPDAPQAPSSSVSIASNTATLSLSLAQSNFGSLEDVQRQLKTERSKRAQVAKETIAIILSLWSELDIPAETEFERHVLSTGTHLHSFQLTASNVEKLNELKETLIYEKESRMIEISSLRECLSKLWNRLRVAEADKAAFLHQHSGYSTSTLLALKMELSKMEVMKTTHMQSFIESARQDLHSLWNQCFFGDEQRTAFTPAFSSNFSEETLQAHELEISRLEQLYAENAHLFELVAKRKHLETEIAKLNSQQSDKDRFSNRGGRLLQEEKFRKQVAKDLPKITGQLIKEIEDWERANSKYFLIDGARYLSELVEKPVDVDTIIGPSVRNVASTVKSGLGASSSAGSAAASTRSYNGSHPANASLNNSCISSFGSSSAGSMHSTRGAASNNLSFSGTQAIAKKPTAAQSVGVSSGQALLKSTTTGVSGKSLTMPRTPAASKRPTILSSNSQNQHEHRATVHALDTGAAKRPAFDALCDSFSPVKSSLPAPILPLSASMLGGVAGTMSESQI